MNISVMIVAVLPPTATFPTDTEAGEPCGCDHSAPDQLKLHIKEPLL